MTILRAVYGEDRKLTFVPFNYTPRPVVPGADLKEDFDIYADLTERCLSMPPTSTMLLFGGELGMTLFLRRAETPELWMEFKAAFLSRYPSFDVRFNRMSAALSELVVPHRNGRRRQPSFSQVVFAAALLATLPVSIRMKIEAPLPNVADQSRCDIELTSAVEGGIVRLEIFGMLSRVHGPVTEHGYDYVQRQPRRLGRYADAGLRLPLTVYADDLWDVSRLRMLIHEARNGLNGRES